MATRQGTIHSLNSYDLKGVIIANRSIQELHSCSSSISHRSRLFQHILRLIYLACHVWTTTTIRMIDHHDLPMCILQLLACDTSLFTTISLRVAATATPDLLQRWMPCRMLVIRSLRRLLRHFLKTFFQHFLDKPPSDNPRHELAYDEAIVLVKRFLEYGASHTVEQVQSFTANKIPCPSWVSKTEYTIDQKYLDKAAALLIEHLGPSGLEVFGGQKWWQYRVEAMKCEWIEMKKDQKLRETHGAADRIILYVHGGAYYFGSVDEHRYQIQRHARKLGGRAFAANYRLSPQFPAPCGIQDNLAAYLYLLASFKPENIILSGDSAGGGMCLALLLVIREQGLPLPAGCVLISPWVDLNHSFPSILADASGDYIPPSGFQHKPSMSWPPPTTDDIYEARNMQVSSDTDSDSGASDPEDGMAFTTETAPANGTHDGTKEASQVNHWK
ncbi:hypothetical protein MRB53_039223 [Persea americana]|nr:hypothetical protein MRB53_039223 [Persea americana]